MKIFLMITLLSIFAPFKVFAYGHTESSISHEKSSSVTEHALHHHGKEAKEGEEIGGGCDCCQDGSDCCKDGCDCCKEGSDWCKDGCDCCKEGSDCCKDGCDCCQDGADGDQQETNTPREHKECCDHNQDKE